MFLGLFFFLQSLLACIMVWPVLCWDLSVLLFPYFGYHFQVLKNMSVPCGPVLYQKNTSVCGMLSKIFFVWISTLPLCAYLESGFYLFFSCFLGFHCSWGNEEKGGDCKYPVRRSVCLTPAVLFCFSSVFLLMCWYIRYCTSKMTVTQEILRFLPSLGYFNKSTKQAQRLWDSPN